jgi:hypothetical protein
MGESLDFELDTVSTFLSRDAGQTWYLIQNGSHIYEFGDHGAIIIMVDNTALTQELL